MCIRDRLMLPLPEKTMRDLRVGDAEYRSVNVTAGGGAKMALMHHLQASGWQLLTTSFANSTNSDGSYMVHKYMWYLSKTWLYYYWLGSKNVLLCWWVGLCVYYAVAEVIASLPDVQGFPYCHIQMLCWWYEATCLLHLPQENKYQDFVSHKSLILVIILLFL